MLLSCVHNSRTIRCPAIGRRRCGTAPASAGVPRVAGIDAVRDTVTRRRYIRERRMTRCNCGWRSLQSFITIGVVVLLWSLHASLADRPVFRWWAWAWTSFAVYLGAGALGLPLTPGWTLTKARPGDRGRDLQASLPPLLLVFGARSVLSHRPADARARRAGLALVLAFSAMHRRRARCGWRDPLAQLSTFASRRARWRSRRRSSTARGCSSRCWRLTGSRASLITGGVCLVYGCHAEHLWRGARRADRQRPPSLPPVVDADHRVAAAAVLVDLVNVYGTCVGLVLLSSRTTSSRSRRCRRASRAGRRSRARISRSRRRSRCGDARKTPCSARKRSSPRRSARTRARWRSRSSTSGTIIDVNDVCVRQSGYSRAEFIGTDSDQLGILGRSVRACERHRRTRGARPGRDPRSAVAQEGRPGGHGALLRRHTRSRRRALRALGRRGHHGAQAGRGHAPRRPPGAAGLDLRHERRAASSSIFTPRIASVSPRRRKSSSAST